MNTIDLGRSFKAFFGDKDWVSKTLLGFLWGLLVVTIPALSGAQVDYIAKVSRGDEDLPGWDDFGNKWVRGFLVSVAGFIYFLPVVILTLFLLVPAIIAVISTGGDDTAVGALVSGLCFYWIIVVVYSIAVSVLFSAATVHYAMTGRFGSFFAIGEILARVRGGTGYFTAWIYTVVISLIGGIAGSVLSATGVGAILYPAVTYFTLMASGHVLGQWAQRAYGLAPAPVYAPPAPPANYPPAAVPPVSYPPAAPPMPAPPAPPAAAPGAPDASAEEHQDDSAPGDSQR